MLSPTKKKKRRSTIENSDIESVSDRSRQSGDIRRTKTTDDLDSTSIIKRDTDTKPTSTSSDVHRAQPASGLGLTSTTRRDADAKPTSLTEVSKRRRSELTTQLPQDGIREPSDQDSEQGLTPDREDDTREHPAVVASRSARDARDFARRLIRSGGEFPTNAFDRSGVASILINELTASAEATNPSTIHAIEMLKSFQRDPALRNAINGLPLPPSGSEMERIMKATIRLDVNERLTAAHVREAAMAALLNGLRQSDVGSCFATCIAIRTQRFAPERFLADIEEMLRTGQLTRQVPKEHGGHESVRVPVSKQTSTQGLRQTIKVSQDGSISDPPKGAAILNLTDLPGFREALTTTGIDPANHNQFLKQALAALGVTPGNPKSITPEQVIRQIIAREVYNGSYNLHRDADRRMAFAKQLEEGIQRDMQLYLFSNSDDENKLEEIEARKNEVAKIRAGVRDRWEEFEKRYSEATNAYVDITDNRLLRAWEYTLSGMAEAAEGASHAEKMTHSGKAAVADMLLAVGETRARDLEDIFDITPPKNPLAVTSELILGFSAEARARYRVVFDPGVELPSLSGDGHSSRGGWQLYDTNNSPDSSKWSKISSEEDYLLSMRLMLLDVAERIRGANRVDGTMAREIAEDVAARLMSENGGGILEQFYVEQNAKLRAGEITANQAIAFPWQNPGGGITKESVRVYYERDPNVIDLGRVGANGNRDIAQSMLNLGAGTEQGLIMRMPGHAFGLRPDLMGMTPQDKADIAGGQMSPLGWLNRKLGEGTSELNPGVSEYWIGLLSEHVKRLYRQKGTDEVAIAGKLKLMRDVVTDKFKNSSKKRPIDLYQALLDYSSSRVERGDENDRAVYEAILTDKGLADELRNRSRGALNKSEANNAIRNAIAKDPLVKKYVKVGSVLEELRGTVYPVEVDVLEELIWGQLIKELTKARQGLKDGSEARVRYGIHDAFQKATAKNEHVVVADLNWGDGEQNKYIALSRDLANPGSYKLIQVTSDGITRKQWQDGAEWQVFDHR